MRIDHDNYGDDAARVCDRVIVQDASGGQGHCWDTIHADDIPHNIAEEIACEMIDGEQEACDDYLAGNGQHYAW